MFANAADYGDFTSMMNNMRFSESSPPVRSMNPPFCPPLNSTASSPSPPGGYASFDSSASGNSLGSISNPNSAGSKKSEGSLMNNGNPFTPSVRNPFDASGTYHGGGAYCDYQDIDEYDRKAPQPPVYYSRPHYDRGDYERPSYSMEHTGRRNPYASLKDEDPEFRQQFNRRLNVQLEKLRSHSNDPILVERPHSAMSDTLVVGSHHLPRSGSNNRTNRHHRSGRELRRNPYEEYALPADPYELQNFANPYMAAAPRDYMDYRAEPHRGMRDNGPPPRMRENPYEMRNRYEEHFREPMPMRPMQPLPRSLPPMQPRPAMPPVMPPMKQEVVRPVVKEDEGIKMGSDVERKKELEMLTRFGESGHRVGQLDGPRGFCLGKDKLEIIVADTMNHRIQIFDMNGANLMQWGNSAERGKGKLFQPQKVAYIHEHNQLVIADKLLREGHTHNRLQSFTREGTLIRTLRQTKESITQGICVFEGVIGLVETKPSMCMVMTPNGQIITSFPLDKMMKEPSDIMMVNAKKDRVSSGMKGPNGEPDWEVLIYICDFGSHCVCVFDEQGNILQRIGHKTPGVLYFPNGIDFDSKGNVLVAHSHWNRFNVSIWRPDGALVDQYELPHMKVSRCCGLAITADGIMVTAATNNNIVVITSFKADGAPAVKEQIEPSSIPWNARRD